MSFKTHLFFLIILLVNVKFSHSQCNDCEIINLTLNDISKLKFQKLNNSYQINFLKRNNIQTEIKNGLIDIFQETVSDSLINIFNTIDLTNYDKINCVSKNIKLYEKSEIEKIKKNNIEQNKIYHNTKYLIYNISPIFHYKNYAIIECEQFLNLTDRLIVIYLLEKNEKGWIIKKILYSAIG